MRKEGGGYSHETEKIFTLWRSKTTGKHFITMAYREYIIGCFFLKRGTAIEGNTLVCTSEQDDFINQCWRCGLPLPQEMQIVVA